MTSQTSYFFIRTGEDEGRAFEVFKRGEDWYWQPRPHEMPPGEDHGPFRTEPEAYNDALVSPYSLIRISSPILIQFHGQSEPRGSRGRGSNRLLM